MYGKNAVSLGVMPSQTCARSKSWRSGDVNGLCPAWLVDVQRRPHRAALFLEESDGHQGNDAVATKQSLLLGASGQVGGSAASLEKTGGGG